MTYNRILRQSKFDFRRIRSNYGRGEKLLPNAVAQRIVPKIVAQRKKP